MNPVVPTVFVSYSHQDEVWKDRVVKHLEVLEFEGDVDVWNDRRMSLGDDLHQIQQAIERASVAVLVVSPDFLTSPFIRQQELTRILERRARQELRVVPLIARPCAWQVVSVLQGLQAWPRDGRPLSSGSDAQVDADLSSLALQIREMVARVPRGTRSSESPNTAVFPGDVTERESSGPPSVGQAPVRIGRMTLHRSTVLLLWLCLPSLVAGLLALGATNWRVPTRVSVQVATRRVGFVVRGRNRPDLLNANRGFSGLTVERCGTLSFQAVEFRIAAISRRDAKVYSGPVHLVCADPDAKVTLAGAAQSPAVVGFLDRMPLDEGATVVVDVASSSGQPVFTLDVSARQRLDLAIHAPLSLTADLVRADPRFQPESPLTVYSVQVPASNPLIRVETGERGTVLIVTPAAEQASEFFSSGMRIPIAQVQFLDEPLNEVGLTTSFVGDGTLSYPDYPSIPTEPVRKNQFFVPIRTSKMEITGIGLTSDRTGMGVTMEGVLDQGAIGAPDTSNTAGDAHWRDPRLTVYEVLRHGSRVGIVAGFAAWVMATTWIGYERWKKLVA